MPWKTVKAMDQKIQLIAEFDEEDYKKYILPRLRSVNAHDLLNIIRR